MLVLTNQRCTEIYGPLIDNKSQLCAGELDSNHGACQGTFWMYKKKYEYID